MQHSTKEHDSQALTRSSPRYLWGLIFLILVGLGGGSLWYEQGRIPRVGGDRPLDQLGNFGVVPEFPLIERSERRVTRNDLLGRVWVVNFSMRVVSTPAPCKAPRWQTFSAILPTRRMSGWYP